MAGFANRLGLTSALAAGAIAVASTAFADSAAAQEPAQYLATCSFDDNVLALDIQGGTFDGKHITIDLSDADARLITIDDLSVRMGEIPGDYGRAQPLENTDTREGYAITLVDQSGNPHAATELTHEFFFRTPDWKMLSVGIPNPESIDTVYVTDHTNSHAPEVIQCEGRGELTLAMNN